MSKKIEKKLPDLKKILSIRFLVLDVDGVLTDGRISYTSSGEEMKSFNVKDGTGISYWMRAGHQVGLISGRSSPMVRMRATELKIPHVVMGAKDKLPAFEKLLAAAGVAPEETAVVGDDLLELPLMRRAGLAIAVRDAVPQIKEAADMITLRKGGKGAVREVIDFMLQAQGRWDAIMERYTI